MDLPLPPDFKEFLKLLNAEGVEYLVVGGYAVGYHGYPRPTAVLDIWVAANAPTAARLVSALEKFGFGAAGAGMDLFLQSDRVIRLGVPPVRIEILTAVSGVSFPECHARRVNAMLDGVPVPIIGRDDLIANKIAAGRDRDRDDVSRLRGVRPS